MRQVKHVLFIAACCAVLALLIAADRADERDWRAYAAAHHCIAIAARQSPPVMGADGQIVPIEQTIYQCDHAELQIR